MKRFSPEVSKSRDEKRFFKKIKKNENGCWIMSGCPMNSGYARFQSDGKRYGAHRFSFLMFKGEIGDGLYVCHKCDVKTCVNPDHLFLGTNYENIQDAKIKGRLKGCRGYYKPACKRGHKRIPENMLKRPNGYWACKICCNLIRRKKSDD